MRAHRTGPARHRKDGNFDAIVEIAEKAGFIVHRTNNELCDATVQFRGITEIWEIKMPLGRLSKAQERSRADGWAIPVIRTAEDVLERRERISGMAMHLWARLSRIENGNS